MKRLLTRILLMLAIVEVIYLGVVNVALNLGATQDFLNRVNPDRFSAQWDRAWSWYPFTFHVSGLSVNGQTWSQHWQVSGPTVEASLAILPLFGKTVRVYDLVTADIDVRFRPRPSPDRDDAEVRQFYPPIQGRDPSLVAGPLPTQKPGWLVVVDIAQISGENNFWVRQTRGTLAGEGRARVMHRSGHGPLAIGDGHAKAVVKSLSVSGQQISERGSIEGTFEFASFVPYKNRGVKTLSFLSSEAAIELPLSRLDFLDFYLGKVGGMKLGGSGSVNGRYAYVLGDLVAGTDLSISADDLTVEQTPYALSGAGHVSVKVIPDNPKVLDTKVSFESLSAYHESDDEELFSGAGMAVNVVRTTQILPGGGDDESAHRRVLFTIPKMTVPDLSAYQRFLPDKWGVQLLGGVGTLEGRAELSANSLEADLTLSSRNAEIRIKDDSFETDLSFGLKLNGEAAAKSGRIDVSGTSLSLNDSRLTDGQGDDADMWQTRLSVNKGGAVFELPEASNVEGERAGFWGVLKEKDLKALLATLEGQFQADLAVSDLDWLNVLFKNPYSLAVHNSAEIKADLIVRSGWFAEGSTLEMRPRDFNVTVLDYVAEGNGSFSVAVERGGERPDLRFEAQLTDASLKLQDEKQSVIDQVTLAIAAGAKRVSLRRGGAVTGLDLNVSSARVTDMSAYNHYLPKGSPLRLLGGEADLTARIQMKTGTATGFVKLQTSRVDAVLDDQPLFGTLALDVDINDGTVRDMAFDISGSSLTLDDVQVAGTGVGPTNTVWSGRIDLSNGRVVWKKPMKLDLDAKIRMTDTRPLVAMFESHSQKHKWLEKILTLENIRGEATIAVKSNEFLVPYAMAKSDTIEIGAKGVIRENDREGIFYARFGKLAGSLEFDNGRRKFDLIGATKKFENYVPGE